MAEMGVPAVAAAVITPGAIRRWTLGSPSVGDLRPVDERTLFQIGSLSKPLTALAVHSLVATGQLSLDQRLGTILLGCDLPDVTVAELLSHRFGIDGDALLTRPPQPMTPAGAVEALAGAAPLGRPGGETSYSNAAYSVLARVVEVITGVAFTTVWRARVLRPWGLRRTMATADEAITSTVALPHASHAGGADAVRGGMGWQPRWQLGLHDLAPAGAISCLDDLAGLVAALLGAAGGGAEGDVALSGDQVKASWRPVAPLGRDEDTALGWLVRKVGGVDVVHHPGVTAGYCASMSLVSDGQVGWVVLTNATGGARLHRRVSAWLLAEHLGVRPDDPPSGADDVTDLLGRYEGGLGITDVEPVDEVGGAGEHGGVRLVHSPHDDGRWQPFPDPPVRLRRVGGTLWGRDDDGEVLEVPLITDGDGRVVALRWGRRLRTRVPFPSH